MDGKGMLWSGCVGGDDRWWGNIIHVSVSRWVELFKLFVAYLRSKQLPYGIDLHQTRIYPVLSDTV